MITGGKRLPVRSVVACGRPVRRARARVLSGLRELSTCGGALPEMPDLSAIVKAYDIRGVVPDELDESIARSVGAAFIRVTGASRIVTAHDMRPSSPGLATAFAQGATSQGADVVEAGLASTDLLYFASGSLDIPGAMFTASHNPARYNGIKLCRAGAAPVGQDTGLRDIKALVEQGIPAYDGAPGTVSQQDLLADYAGYLRSLVDLSGIRRLKVVVDAGNGMGGHTVPTVLDGLPVDLVPMYFELAFDGDADRCFAVDERGEPVSPSAVTALVAARELAKHPGAVIIHNLITSWSVPEVVAEHGGKAVRTRVGHSFIKQRMAEEGAVFGGEHSAHYYFRDFWNADTGMLAALHLLAALGAQDGPLSALVASYDRYAASGEINSTVADQAERTAAVRAAFTGQEGVTFDELDGLTVTAADWWFNLRASNTEPLLRLNVEARDTATVARLRDQVLGIVRA